MALFGPLSSKGNFRRKTTKILGNRGQLWTSTLSPHLESPHLDFPDEIFESLFCGPEKSRKIPAKLPAKFPSPKSKKFTDELLQEHRENKQGTDPTGQTRLYMRRIVESIFCLLSCEERTHSRLWNPPPTKFGLSGSLPRKQSEKAKNEI